MPVPAFTTSTRRRGSERLRASSECGSRPCQSRRIRGRRARQPPPVGLRKRTQIRREVRWVPPVVNLADGGKVNIGNSDTGDVLLVLLTMSRQRSSGNRPAQADCWPTPPGRRRTESLPPAGLPQPRADSPCTRRCACSDGEAACRAGGRHVRCPGRHGPLAQQDLVCEEYVVAGFTRVEHRTTRRSRETPKVHDDRAIEAHDGRVETCLIDVEETMRWPESVKWVSCVRLAS